MTQLGDPTPAASATTSPALARGQILLATILWSTSGIFSKSPWFEIWPVEERGLQLAFWRAAFAGCALLPFVKKISWPPLLGLAALCFAAMNTSFLMAMTMTTAANAIWLQYAAPAWVFLVGVGLLRERARSADYLMLVFAVLGVGWIAFGEWSHATTMDHHVLGSLLGVVSGIAFAGVVLCVRGLRGHDSAWVISVCLLTSALVLLPYVIGKGNWPNPKVMTGLALFGASQLALPYILFAWGTREVTSHEASFITLLEPLLVPVWVWLVWGGRPEYEFPASWTLVGGGLILTGLVIRFIRLWNAPPLPPGR